MAAAEERVREGALGVECRMRALRRLDAGAWAIPAPAHTERLTLTDGEGYRSPHLHFA